MNKLLNRDGVTDDDVKDRRLTETIALTAGVIGLFSDFLQWPRHRILNVHLLFGVALLTAVARALIGKWRSTRGNSGNQYYLFTRWLARRVYRLLYVMAAVRLCFFAIEAYRAPTWAETFRYLGSGGSLQDFLVYIGYGFVAVCLIRMCAALMSRVR